MVKVRRHLQVNFDRRADSKWSWLVCFSSFCVQFIAGGIPNSFGSFFVALLKEFKRTEAETAWIGSLAMGMTYLCGPVSTSLCHRFGCRIVACTGSLLLVISAFLTSLAHNLMIMYLTFGLLGGIALSMLYFSSLVVLIEYFNKRLSLANGLVLAGSGAGTLCLSLLLGDVCSRFGVQAGFRAVAGVAVIGFIAGLSYAPVKKDFLKEESKEEKNMDTSCGSRLTNALKPGPHWHNKAFVAWTLSLALVFFAIFIPFVYLVRVAKMHGVPTSKGSLLVGFMAISQTFGKIIFGRISDLRGVNRLLLMQITLLCMAVAMCLFPLARSYSSLVSYAVVHGFLDGGSTVLLAIVTHDIVGKKLMAGALGSMFGITAIPLTAGSPVAGFIYDLLGSYNAVYFLGSGLMCTGVCLMFLIPWLVPASSSTDLEQQQLLLHNTTNGPMMSSVTEDKLANLLGKKTAADLLLERNRSLLDHSLSGNNTRPSSFVLFSIVTDDNYRDVSTYTSRADLNLTSGTNTPLRGTPHFKRILMDSDCRTSTISLQSFSRPSVTGSCVHIDVLDTIPDDRVLDGDEASTSTKCQAVLKTVKKSEQSQLNKIEGDKRLSSVSCMCSGRDSSIVSSSQESIGTNDSGFTENSFVINTKKADNSNENMLKLDTHELLLDEKSENVDFYSVLLEDNLEKLENIFVSLSSLNDNRYNNDTDQFTETLV